MSNVLRSTKFAAGIVFIVASTFIVEYFFPNPSLTFSTQQLGNWAIVFSAYAMGYGLFTLLVRHGSNVIKSGGKNLFSLWLLIVLITTVALGLRGGVNDPGYRWMFDYVYTGLGATLYSFAFLYLCSAAVRVLRFRTIEESLLSIAAVIVLLGNTPLFATYTTIFMDIEAWIFSVPSRGVYTAFNISVAIGMVLIGLRTMTGIERGWLGVLFGEE